MIGDDIVVTVIESTRDQIRIGIDAPRHVSVHRHEVYAEIQRENEAARSAAAPELTGGHRPVVSAALPLRPRP